MTLNIVTEMSQIPCFEFCLYTTFFFFKKNKIKQLPFLFLNLAGSPKLNLLVSIFHPIHSPLALFVYLPHSINSLHFCAGSVKAGTQTAEPKRHTDRESCRVEGGERDRRRAGVAVAWSSAGLWHWPSICHFLPPSLWHWRVVVMAASDGWLIFCW